MLAEDTLLFIDANRYLDLYRRTTWKALLAPLRQQADHIFVTQQIVEEVHRGKLTIAARILTGKAAEEELQPIPDQFWPSDEQNKALRKRSRAIADEIRAVNKELTKLAAKIMEEISRSEDEVSKALNSMFAKAVPHTQQELERARDRKKRGNPPGKENGPLGDQLNWEQILTHFRGKKRLWIISKDGDYGTIYQKERFLNPLLYQELCNVAGAPKVFWFDQILEGIEDFAAKTGVKADKLPTPKKAEEIREEEKRLPPLGLFSGDWAAASGTMINIWKQHDWAARHARIFASGESASQLPPDVLEPRQPMIYSGMPYPGSVPPTPEAKGPERSG